MTTTDLAVRTDLVLAIRPDQTYWTPKQKAALEVLGIRGATEADLAVYMHVCQKTGLDPFTRQIYYIKRREMVNGSWVEKWTVQVGIDGFRVIRDRVADRTGCVVEFEDTTWYDGTGGEHAVWLDDDPPAACKVTLVKYQDGRPLRYPAVLRTASYMATKDGKPVSQWKTQADHMIEKCCEAFATRRAFPNDLGGLYIEEEAHAGLADRQAPARRVTRAEILREDPAAGDDTPPGARHAAAGDKGTGPKDRVTQPPGDGGEGARKPADARAARTASPRGAQPPPPQDHQPGTVAQVDAEFARLGFTAADRDTVIKAAAQLAGRDGDLASVGHLTRAELGVVRDALAKCGTRDRLDALLATGENPPGGGDDG